MKKDELVLLVKEIFKFETKKEAEEYLGSIDTLVETIAERLEIKGKVKVGKYIEVEKKHIDAKPSKNGEITRVIDGVKTKVPYTTEAKPEHDEIRLKATKALNKAE